MTNIFEQQGYTLLASYKESRVYNRGKSYVKVSPNGAEFYKVDLEVFRTHVELSATLKGEVVIDFRTPLVSFKAASQLMAETLLERIA